MYIIIRYLIFIDIDKYVPVNVLSQFGVSTVIGEITNNVEF